MGDRDPLGWGRGPFIPDFVGLKPTVMRGGGWGGSCWSPGPSQRAPWRQSSDPPFRIPLWGTVNYFFSRGRYSLPLRLGGPEHRVGRHRRHWRGVSGGTASERRRQVRGPPGEASRGSLLEGFSEGGSDDELGTVQGIPETAIAVEKRKAMKIEPSPPLVTPLMKHPWAFFYLRCI